MTRKDLKIVCISDIHGDLPDNVPEGDVLVITGDIVPLHIQRDNIASAVWIAREFNDWCKSLPHKHVLLCWGNHDFVGEYMRIPRGVIVHPNNVISQLRLDKKIKLLDDTSCNIAGYKFYGTSWCPALRNWAFYKDSEDLRAAYNKIPKNVDVLLTHCPPKIESYGTVLESGFNYMNDFGSTELADVIKEKKPRLHVFGHVHSGNHVPALIDGTVLCNCSLKTEQYQLYYDAKVFLLQDSHIQYLQYDCELKTLV